MFNNSFPAKLNSDLKIVLELIPSKTFNNVSFAFCGDMIEYNLKDETIKIPYRMYFIDVDDTIYNQLTETQKIILCCIYTRSCEGFIREKYLKKLLEIDFPYWAIPFIVKLCDEYVIEILYTTYDYLKGRDNSDIIEFCLNNKAIVNRGYNRMISYWNEFYRDREYRFHKYIGRILYRECFGHNRSFS